MKEISAIAGASFFIGRSDLYPARGAGSCPGPDERECHRRDRINNGDRIRNAHRDGNRIRDRDRRND